MQRGVVPAPATRGAAGLKRGPARLLPAPPPRGPPAAVGPAVGAAVGGPVEEVRGGVRFAGLSRQVQAPPARFVLPGFRERLVLAVPRQSPRPQGRRPLGRGGATAVRLQAGGAGRGLALALRGDAVTGAAVRLAAFLPRRLLCLSCGARTEASALAKAHVPHITHCMAPCL